MSDFNNINQLVNQISEAVKHFSCFTNVCDSTLNLELELRFIKWKRLITEGIFFIICNIIELYNIVLYL